MVQTPSQPTKLLTVEAFLHWDSGDDLEYDLVEGVPVPVSDPNANHEDLAFNLCRLLADHCRDRELPLVPRLRKKVVLLKSEPEEKDMVRTADLVVFDLEEWSQLKDSPSAAVAYTPPPLVVEAVSTNWRADYLTKLGEYEALGIPEYWIVDYAALGAVRYTGVPKQPTLSIYTMTEGMLEGEYQVNQFRGEDAIASPTFPDLGVTANDIFELANL